MTDYIIKGDLASVKFLHESGTPWSFMSTAHAVGEGIEMLKYVYENGASWSKYTIIYAVDYSVDILQYAHENGAPYNIARLEKRIRDGTITDPAIIEYINTKMK